MAKAAAQTKEPIIDHSLILREVADKPILVLTDQSKLDAYLAALRADVDANPGDINTAKGRDIIKSNAAEIGRKKTAIDKERLRATEEYRVKTAIINTAGKVVKERFQSLQDEVRAPLTAWEEREEARLTEAKAILDDMRQAIVIEVGATSAQIQERLDRIRGRNLSDETFGPRIHEATDLRDEAVAALAAALERIKQEEADRAELLRLREEREQRAREDAARLEREAEERAAAERQRLAAEAEAQRMADQAARIDRERQEAAERAHREVREAAEREAREAEARAQAEQVRIQREHEEALSAERRRAEEAERAAQEERDRAARAQASRDAAARAEAEEQARKAADLSHRAVVKDAARDAIIGIGIPALKADKLVQAITAGDIPHVAITF